MRLRKGSSKGILSMLCICMTCLLVGLALTSCRKAGQEPNKVLERFFYLLDNGKYNKAAEICEEDIDPDLLDFTYIVTLRFMERVITAEHERNKDEARYHVYLILKDGKELVYYARTSEGRLLPGSMMVRNVAKDSEGYCWKVHCDEFWERHHWQDITQKMRLTIISVVEQTIAYRDSTGMLPEGISQIYGEALDTIINPVTGEEHPFVTEDNIAPGTISLRLDEELKEFNIKGYDVLGEEIEYYIVTHKPGTEKASLLEFFDVPPRKLSMVIPSYPESEREEGREGVVGLNLLIGRDGMVHEVKVEKSVSPVFDSLAVDAVTQSIFSPAKRDGKPVAVWYQFPVRFVLEE